MDLTPNACLTFSDTGKLIKRERWGFGLNNLFIFQKADFPYDFTVKVKENDKKTGYQITTNLTSKAESGELSGEVIIHTSSSVQPTVRVPFFGIIADSKSVPPPKVQGNLSHTPAAAIDGTRVTH